MTGRTIDTALNPALPFKLFEAARHPRGAIHKAETHRDASCYRFGQGWSIVDPADGSWTGFPPVTAGEREFVTGLAARLVVPGWWVGCPSLEWS